MLSHQKLLDRWMNKKFNRLKIINFSHKNFGHYFWLCKCDCGIETKVDIGHLTNGHTKSCGCLQIEKLKLIRSKPKGEAALQRLFCSYKFTSKKRNIKWYLSKKEFKVLTQGNCFYCGIEPKQSYKLTSTGNYIYNGIDRLNSFQGYCIENCVSCCKLCNYAKRNLSVEEFKKQISQIYNYFIKGES